MPTAGQGLGSLIASFAAPTGADNPVYGQELLRLAQTDSARGSALSAQAQAQLAMQKAADARELAANKARTVTSLRAQGRNDEADFLASFDGTAEQFAQAQRTNQQAGYLKQAAALIPHPAQGLGDIVGGGPPAPARRISDEDFSLYQLLSNLGGRDPIKAATVEGNTYFDPTRITGTDQTTTDYGRAMIEKAEAQAERVGVPAGYRATPNGNLSYIPGGPADPTVVAPLATARATAHPAAGQAAPAGYQWNADHTALVFIAGGPADPARVTATATARNSAGQGVGSEDERKAAGWFQAADNAFANIKTLVAKNPNAGTPTAVQAALYELPSFGLGGSIADATRSDEKRQFDQSMATFGDAVLRAATGAGQNEGEVRRKMQELTPAYLDSPAVKAQKIKGMEVYLASLKSRAGRALTKPGAAPATQVAPTGRSVTMAAVTQFAQAHGLNPAAVKADREAKGWTVTP